MSTVLMPKKTMNLTAWLGPEALVFPADQGTFLAYDNSGNRTNTLTPEGETLSHSIQAVSGSSEVIFSKAMASKSWLRGRANPQAEVKVDGQVAARDGEIWKRLLTLTNPYDSQLATITATRNDLTPTPTPVTKTLSLRANETPHEPYMGLHDERGNLQADAHWIYTWDAENRLVKQEMRFSALPGVHTALVKRLEFRYDGKGRRIHKRETYNFMTRVGDLSGNWHLTKETVYLWQDWTLVAEFVKRSYGNLFLRRSYLWGLDVNGRLGGAGGVGGLLWVADYVPDLTASNRQLAPWYDGNGNVMGWVENEGAQKLPLYRLEYDPYGKLLVDDAVRVALTKKQRDLYISSSDLERPPFTFSTKYEDAESGLLYYGYRYYAPEMGRWLSRDPIAERGGINLHGMVGNDPVNKWDYLGLWKIERKSTERRVYAYAEKNDTIRSLAKKIHLNVDEAEKWAKGWKPSDGESILEGCGISVPNVMLVALGDTKPANWLQAILGTTKSSITNAKTTFQTRLSSMGYNVVDIGEPGHSEFSKQIKDPDVTGFWLGAHGGAGGAMLTDENGIFPDDIKRLRPFKLSLIYLNVCSAGSDSAWKSSCISSLGTLYAPTTTCGNITGDGGVYIDESDPYNSEGGSDNFMPFSPKIPPLSPF
ncbi:MAG: RHS repeat-associated core domain-containing protein [Verrucomicrobiota bacterium]